MGRPCPRCGSFGTRKYGRSRQGRQRWKCNDCGSTFSERTGTVLASMKLPPRKFELLVALMLRDSTLETVSEVLGVSSKTAYLWRLKLFSCFAEFQKGSILSGKVWIDEAFFALEKKKWMLVNGDGRGPRNQIMVLCGVDSSGRRFAVSSGSGHLTKAKVMKIYGNRIKLGSLLVHDGIFPHRILVNSLGLSEEVAKSSWSGSKRTMQPINSFIAEIKRSMYKHIGGRSEYIQIYMDWIVYKGTLKGMKMKDKIAKTLAFCIQSGVVFRTKDRY